jgi:hypothetical protein
MVDRRIYGEWKQQDNVSALLQSLLEFGTMPS